MDKSPEAFRTISEVADWLGTPAHVLRFWESRFTQVKPVKRAGGRRYYRPADMVLLGGIKKLLHDEGMTIRGVQKLLRESGAKHVASLSDPIDGTTTADAPAKMAVDVQPEDPENVVTLAPSQRVDAPETVKQTDQGESDTSASKPPAVTGRQPEITSVAQSLRSAVNAAGAAPTEDQSKLYQALFDRLVTLRSRMADDN